MIVCGCTGATDRDVRQGTPRGLAAGQQCGGCRPAVEEWRPRPDPEPLPLRETGGKERFSSLWSCQRLDGRIELTCVHGVGHPSRVLQEAFRRRPWSKYDGIHGCDGCCGDLPAFEAAEAELAERVRARKMLLSPTD